MDAATERRIKLELEQGETIDRARRSRERLFASLTFTSPAELARLTAEDMAQAQFELGTIHGAASRLAEISREMIALRATQG